MFAHKLSIRNISKYYNGKSILNHVSIDFLSGEVHALCGENASGKSTLIKVLSNLEIPEKGELYWDGELIPLKLQKQKRPFSIETVYQSSTLFDELSISENIFFKALPSFIDYSKVYRLYDKIASRLQLNFPGHIPLSNLSLAQKRMIEIAKALVSDADIFIFDEPTESFSQHEVNIFISILHELKAQNKIVIIATHKISEVAQMCDRVTVLHDGTVSGNLEAKNASERTLLKMMTGNELKNRYPKIIQKKGAPLLQIRNLNNNYIKNISFTLYEREILGITGLVGCGKSSIARALFGLEDIVSGSVYINGKKVQNFSPKYMLSSGCGYLSDEILQNLIPDFDLSKNVSLGNLTALTKFGLLRIKAEKQLGSFFQKTLAINLPEQDIPIKYLSGGTQQKIALSKLLNLDLDILILDEPTIGLDSAAKSDLYNFMNEYVNKRRSILLISSDFSEISGMCDRVMIMKNGTPSCFLNHDELSRDKIVANTAFH